MTASPTFCYIMSVYAGSKGDDTRALYDALQLCGPQGLVAIDLFRACKASERAKVYRGGQRGRGSYRRMAYEKKSWAIDNLAQNLSDRAAGLGIVWGWGVDPAQDYHRDVLYIDLPTGQVSFHAAPRGVGPDYPGAWDGARGVAPTRICKFCAMTLGAA